jgi:hypothetical protein
MNTVVEPYKVKSRRNVRKAKQESATSSTITMTLYDLIAAVQNSVEPAEEALVVPIVMHMLQSYRATYLRTIMRYTN